MRDLPRSINSLPGAARLSVDVAMVRLPLLTSLPRWPISLTAAAAGTTQRLSRKPSPGVTTDACQMSDEDGLKISNTSSGAVGEVEKGRNEIVSALFRVRTSSDQLTRGDRPLDVLERGCTCLGDREGHAAAAVARARQSKPLGQRHGAAVQLQMGARIRSEKSDDELRAVGASDNSESWSAPRRSLARLKPTRQP